MLQSCGVFGLITRSAVPADAPAVHRLIADSERRHGGSVVTAVDAVAADLARPTLDLARDTLLVYDPPGGLVGSSWMHIGRRAVVHVHPGHEGRGLGTRLLAWTESPARATGSHDLGQTINDANTAATALLRAHGYHPKVTQWRLAIDLPAAKPAVPAGIDVRPFQPGDEQTTYRMAEGAFMDWQERRRSYEEWSKLTIARAAFAPALSPLAFHCDRLVAQSARPGRPHRARRGGSRVPPPRHRPGAASAGFRRLRPVR
jgi:GNAT superfamily N-acetyltransferase